MPETKQLKCPDGSELPDRKGCVSQLLALMRSALYTARTLHPASCTLHQAAPPPPPPAPPQPSVNRAPASVHAINRADGLEVVEYFGPNCLSARRRAELFTQAWLPGTSHSSANCVHTCINMLYATMPNSTSTWYELVVVSSVARCFCTCRGTCLPDVTQCWDVLTLDQVAVR